MRNIANGLSRIYSKRGFQGEKQLIIISQVLTRDVLSMDIIATIIPIFIVILLGLVVRVKGFISESFVSQANRLVYTIAIPAMIFSAISQSTLTSQMNLSVILICFAALIFAAIIAPWNCKAFQPNFSVTPHKYEKIGSASIR